MATEYVANRGGLDGFDTAPDKFSRQAVGLHLGAPFVKTTGAQVRAGVIRANGNPLGYVATSLLSATLKAGVYLLPTTADIGPVQVVVPSDQTFTHDTAHASQPRTDLIIVEVVDNGDNTSTKKVRILKGTAGVSAPDPTLPSSLGNGAVVTIHRVLIPAAATTLSTITDLRTYTAAVGGVVTVAGAVGTPSLASALPPDTPVWDSTAVRLGIRDTSTGLTALDDRPHVRTYSMLRAAVPASGNTSYDPADFGYALTWTLFSNSTGAPATSTSLSGGVGWLAGTELVIGTAGWYRLDGNIQTHASNVAVGSIRVQISSNSGSSWDTVYFDDMPIASSFGNFFDRPRLYAVGDRIRVGVSRTCTTSGNITGAATLTFLRSTL